MKITQSRINKMRQDRDKRKKEFQKLKKEILKKYGLDVEQLAIQKETRVISSYEFKLREKKSNKIFDLKT